MFTDRQSTVHTNCCHAPYARCDTVVTAPNEVGNQGIHIGKPEQLAQSRQRCVDPTMASKHASFVDQLHNEVVQFATLAHNNIRNRNSVITSAPKLQSSYIRQLKSFMRESTDAFGYFLTFSQELVNIS